MKRLILLIIVSFLQACFSSQKAQEKNIFSGQLSAWGHYNNENSLPVGFGVRYIPDISYGISLSDEKLLDFELSANIYGTAALDPFDSARTEGNIKAYRAWLRFSASQFELRLGLQKINFGSASLLRPLMWFDRIDPRDPLQLTDGVWGLLGRYYFLNNTNIWIWALYGNNDEKTWEIGKTRKNTPEFGGRLQMPVPKGEAAVSYHFRKADTRTYGSYISPYDNINENRLGIDAKWDVEVGLWFEGAWINKDSDIGIFKNQEILNLGTDYTFAIGNGLNLTAEHLITSFDNKAFTFSNNSSFSALSVSYPLGVLDNLNAIFYYQWNGRSLYNFINWKSQFSSLDLYVMAYWNPSVYQLPQQQQGGNSNAAFYAGKGIQLMLVYNH